jgi:hypothetical protein
VAIIARRSALSISLLRCNIPTGTSSSPRAWSFLVDTVTSTCQSAIQRTFGVHRGVVNPAARTKGASAFPAVS